MVCRGRAMMAALAQMELEVKRERNTDSVSERRAGGKDLGGRLPGAGAGAGAGAASCVSEERPTNEAPLITWRAC
jgi:DNA invertase Pin-like site-specific DNA recombinase